MAATDLFSSSEPVAVVGFPTTFGFKKTCGFDLNVTATDVHIDADCEQDEPTPEAPCPSSKTALTPSLGTLHVGWRGLLEISQQSGSSGVLGTKAQDGQGSAAPQMEICCTAHSTTATKRLVKSVIRGLKACQEPEKALDGMGGTYFFTNDAGKKAAIFKPCDEEPLAPNNPKGYVGRQLGDPGWKPTVRVGEAAMREVAAYLLDYDNWARVPTSVLVRARHPILCYKAQLSSARRSSCIDLVTVPSTPSTAIVAESSINGIEACPKASMLPMKLGSLQEFVQHECDTSEMGPSRFSVKDVHRIGILDVRLFNTDRHAGNILVRMPRSSMADLKNRVVDASYELIPIDHGFCLPETLEAPYFEWLHWPQTLASFTEEELLYIRELDVEKDKAVLRQELPNLRPECSRVLEVSTTLLQMCAAAGLNLFEIASVMTRPFEDSEEEPSQLERICVHAKQCAQYRVQYAIPEEDGSDADEDMGSLASPVMPASGGAAAAEDMLFDLDEDGTRHSRDLGMLESHCSSKSPSPGSSPATSSLEMSIGANGIHSFMGVANGAVAARGQAQARSLVPLTLVRAMKARQQFSKIPKRFPQVYPPPMLSFAPESLQGFFSDFTEPLWALFMQELQREIEEVLCSGKWRQAAQADTAIAMSCPRF